MSRLRFGLIAVVMLSSSCSSGADVTLLTHDSFSISQDVLDGFTEETGIEVDVLQAGDAGGMLNQAILTKDNPVADVIFGVDNTFASRALAAGILLPYEPAALATVPQSLHIDPRHRLIPIDFGDVCLNYDRNVIADERAPQDLKDLTEERFRGQLVVENPATSSPGLAFLLATIARFPDDSAYTWMDYWRDLRANGVLVTDGWETAYYSEFSGGAGAGDRPLVVSYASSPPAEVIFADPPVDEAPTAVVTGGCFRQVEYAGILAGTDSKDAAGMFLDFMLSLPFQEDVPLNMFVYPANRDAALPPEFVKYASPAESPLVVDPAAIEANRERWIDEWTDIVIR